LLGYDVQLWFWHLMKCLSRTVLASGSRPVEVREKWGVVAWTFFGASFFVAPDSADLVFHRFGGIDVINAPAEVARKRVRNSEIPECVIVWAGVEFAETICPSPIDDFGEAFEFVWVVT